MLTIAALLFWLSLFLLFWMYFGYPLLMRALSQWRAHPVQKADLTPSLTLLIPAYNEADVIHAKLENSLSLDYPRESYEVLVVDDGSDDGTRDIIAEAQERGVTAVFQPQRKGKMAAVNAGFAQARGEIVVLSDASPIFDTDALRLLVRSFADPTVGVVVGSLVTRDRDTGVAKQAGMYWRYEAALRKWESSTGSTVAVHGNMFAIRKSCFRSLQAGTINDEFSLAMETIRQGYRVIYEPAAISYDEASLTMRDEVNRRSRINAGRFQALFSAGYLRAPNASIAFRLISHKMLRPFAPIFMLLVLATNILIVLASNRTPHLLKLTGWWGVLILAGQIVFYALAVMGWRMEKRGRKPPLVLSVPYFFVSTNLAALVGLVRYLRGSQRVTWIKRGL